MEELNQVLEHTVTAPDDREGSIDVRGEVLRKGPSRWSWRITLAFRVNGRIVADHMHDATASWPTQEEASEALRAKMTECHDHAVTRSPEVRSTGVREGWA